MFRQIKATSLVAYAIVLGLAFALCQAPKAQKIRGAAASHTAPSETSAAPPMCWMRIAHYSAAGCRSGENRGRN